MIKTNDDLGLKCNRCGEIWLSSWAMCPSCHCEDVEPVFIEDVTEVHHLIHELVDNEILSPEIRNRIIDYLREFLPYG